MLDFKATSRSYLVTAKRILRYVKGTINYGLLYDRSEQFTCMGIQMQIGLEIVMIKGHCLMVHLIQAIDEFHGLKL